MASLDEAQTNYRYPHYDTLAVWSRQPINDWSQFADAVRSLQPIARIDPKSVAPWTDVQIVEALTSVDGVDDLTAPALTWDNAEVVAAVLK